MKFFVKLLVVLLSTASVSSWAGDSEGLVSVVLIQAPGIAIIKAGTIVNTPGCNTTNQWAVSMVKPEGNMYALALSAQSQGLPLTVHGFNVCQDWGDREQPSYMYILE